MKNTVNYIVFTLMVSMCAGVMVAGLTGCSSARQAKFLNMNKHDIRLFSGGKLIGEWKSRGPVLSEDESDGWFFMEDVTGKLLQVSGDVVITKLDEPGTF